MLYEAYFQLKQRPFSIAPNPQFLCEYGQYMEALAALEYGLTHRGGFVLLTGEVGTGKTTLCKQLLSRIPAGTEIALVLHPQLDRVEFLQAICQEFGIDDEGSKIEIQLIHYIHRYLLDVYSKGDNAVLVIDEAQHLDLSVLELVRLLTNLETSEEKLLQIILVGQPELNTRLDRYELRQLNQRITVRFHLNPLKSAEVNQYIQHRLWVAGTEAKLFSSMALRALHTYSGGIPRIINVIADRALMGAYAESKTLVGRSLLKKAALEVLPRKEANNGWLKWLSYAAPIAIVLSATGYYYYPQFVKKEAAVAAAPTVPATPSSVPATPSSVPAATTVKEITSQPRQLFNNAPESLTLSDLATDWSVSPEDVCFWPRQCWQGVLPLNLIRKSHVPALVKSQNSWVRLTGQPRASKVMGEVQIIWQPPFQLRSTIRVGEQSEHLYWIRDQLSHIAPRNSQALAGWEVIQPSGNGLGTEDESYYDWLLEAQVKNFQQANGLKVDGLIGKQTLIALWLKEQAKYARESKDSSDKSGVAVAGE